MKNEVKILKALADETRLKIVLSIGDDEICACELVPFTKKAQPTVSQHLKILLGAGVLSQRKEGKHILYRIKDRRVLKLIEVLGVR
jgi:DNA-binding transcriptional ArsR family regulator